MSSVPPHSHTEKGTRLDAETIKQHAIFVGLTALSNKRDTKLFAADIAHSLKVGNRLSTAATTALLVTISISFVSVLFGWSPALLSLSLVALFKLIIEGLPAAGLIWDGLFKYHGAKLENHQSISHSVWDGIIAGLITASAFFALFWWYGISSQATEAQSILHGLLKPFLTDCTTAVILQHNATPLAIQFKAAP